MTHIRGYRGRTTGKKSGHDYGIERAETHPIRNREDAGTFQKIDAEEEVCEASSLIEISGERTNCNHEWISMRMSTIFGW